MGRRVVIDPVSRIEGHARVTIELDDRGAVADARVHVAELRGIESLCEGRPIREMPALTARICGICPVSHALAAALAGDRLLGAEPPPTARRLRDLVQYAQLVQSHAVSFFYLSGPDLVLGPEAEPSRRNILGVAEVAPGFARDGVALRQFGQETIERVAGRRVHAPFAVPGGVTRPLASDDRERILADLPAALAIARRALGWWRMERGRAAAALDGVGPLETRFLALVADDGTPAFTGGRLRVTAADGTVDVEGLPSERFREIVGEAAHPWTYTRLAFRHAGRGHPPAIYRVGPLARLAVADRCGTPLADEALAELRAGGGSRLLSPFDGHAARLVEIVHALERMERLLADPAILGADVLAPAGAPACEAVGCCEAPRGTLFHHYRTGPGGLVTWASFVVATGQNALALDLAVRRTAERWLEGRAITPPLLARVEAAVRAFDPCFSCATHVDGSGPVSLQLVDRAGRVLDQR